MSFVFNCNEGRLIRLMKLLISDIKSIIRVPVLTCALMTPLVILLTLLFCSPLIERLTGSENSDSFVSYYSVAAITLISAIPFIYGLFFSFFHLNKTSYNHKESSESKGSRSDVLISRITVLFILSFIMILAVIFFTDPVSTEGWLRNIYAALLLSAASPFIFLLLVAYGVSRARWIFLSMIALVFLLAVPSGMALHHPWNYFAFFSPFYWSGWAWVITSPMEGLIYGAISLGISVAGSIIFYRSIQVNEL
jgi:hypothetical protein